MIEILKALFEKYNIKANEQQLKQFETYFNLLVEWNEKFNLTAITEKHDVAVKHFLDSVLPLSELKNDSKIIDIGTGAGFPSIPLKILNPSLHITMVDSLQKRVFFLNEVITKLNLKNIKAVHARAEDLAKTTERESYNYVVSRAVAKLNTLSEYCAPFLINGGTFIAYKSENINEEILESQKAFYFLHLKIEKIKNYNIENNNRNLIFITKLNTIDKKYPRDKNKPKTNPL